MDEVDRARIEKDTYRYVRWMMIVLPGLLLGVTLVIARVQGELETSISAYYGGPVRDILVGTLIATAACLVAYQGVGLLEDYALNGAGFYAVFVALVPTGFADIMADLRAQPTADGMTATDYGQFLRVALTGVVLLCLVLFVRELVSGRIAELVRARTDTVSKSLTRVFVGLTSVVLVWFLALAMLQLWRGPADQITMEGVRLMGWQVSIHFLAAVFLIVSLTVAVLTNTWPFFAWDRSLWRSGRGAYLVIVALMTVGLLIPWGVSRAFAPDHLVILLEWWELAMFIGFWIMETVRLGRRTLAPATPGPLQEPQRDPVPQDAPASSL
ncbi:hypothetical protein [Ornithinimicrobium cerasi]|uniref:Uncharacterized protein n=1 Tax=Ornithinimicrobium cerasi TaxID=2248773 RepID=A0A285VRZ0_9MICO|nr:hypothetical protein [Ornithinimicrobium cerasi]SOC56723.1 hypothetical protein SAMN05421879_108114 [Ornithinimicrobium cerasi]